MIVNIVIPGLIGFGTGMIAQGLGFPITHIAYWLIFALGMASYFAVKHRI
jgi:hypothetical protein